MRTRRPEARSDEAIATEQAEARAADRAGDLDRAAHLATAWLRGLPPTAGLDQRCAAFRLHARVLRHRDDAASLASALDSAVNATRLARGAGVGPAELEIAACRLALGETARALGIARRWHDDPDPSLGAWAWAITGRAQLDDDPLASVPALHNAIAECRRGQDTATEHVVRIALAIALGRVGRVRDCAAVLSADRTHWDGSPGRRRLTVSYLLVAAGNALREGRVDRALAHLDEAEALVEACTGMPATEAELLRIRADCLLEWGQVPRAERARRRATRVMEQLPTAPAPAIDPAPVTSPPEPVLLSQGPSGAGRDDGPHRRLTGCLAMTSARIALRDRPGSPWLPSRRGRVRSPWGVERMLDEAARLGVTEEAEAVRVVECVEALAGLPGWERTEAFLLHRAGRLLTDAQVPVGLLAERLLRRCHVRVQFLPGMDMLRARAEIALAEVVARDPSRRDEALDLVVGGLTTLDAERFRMSRRDYRNTWLTEEVHPAHALAIELAVEHGRDDLAADLVVFSRASGIISPPDRDRPATEITLLPLPRLRYLDGARSSLGGEAECHYR